MDKSFVGSIFCVMILAGCISQRAPSHSYFSVTEVVWNEDTINTLQLTIAKDSSFVYTVIKEGKKPVLYPGRLCKAFCRDTLYLCYDSNKMPPGLANYLIEEISGNYYIQHFTDGSPCIFMRRRNLSLNRGLR